MAATARKINGSAIQGGGPSGRTEVKYRTSALRWSTVTGKTATNATSPASRSGDQPVRSVRPACSQEAHADAEKGSQQHEVGQVAQVHDVGAGPPDQRQLQEEHQRAAEKQSSRDRHNLPPGTDDLHGLTTMPDRARGRTGTGRRQSPGVVGRGQLEAMTTLRPPAPTGLSTVRLRAAIGLPVAVGTALAIAYLLAPPMGADLSAQVAWAEVAARQWPALLDLSWYGGINPLGYSILAPPLMAMIGVRLATGVGYLLGVVLVAALLQRLEVRRPVAGGVVAAIGLAANLASSRTTFVLGLAVAVGALLAVAYDRRRLAVLLAVLTALTSPVAAVFLALAGVALALSGRRRIGTWISVAAAGPTIVVGVLFGNGGSMPFGPGQAVLAVLASLIVVAGCRDVPVVCWGASAVGGVCGRRLPGAKPGRIQCGPPGGAARAGGTGCGQRPARSGRRRVVRVGHGAAAAALPRRSPRTG